MERRILSDFLSDQGFKVETLERLSGWMDLSHTTLANDEVVPQCVVIIGISGTQNQSQLQVAEAVAAYPGVPIILLADRAFCVDAQSPHIEAIHALVRRPVQLEEIEWILQRLSKTKQTGANQQ
jgi:hypothetical protein